MDILKIYSFNLKQNMVSCPVCRSKNIQPNVIHKRWGTVIVECKNCTHNFSERTINEKEDNFRTNKQRAEYYLEKIQGLDINSILDIGTPKDFFFLEGVRNNKANISAYSFDIFEKDIPPGIKRIERIGEVPVDLVTAFHVLEHVEDPIGFIVDISRSCKYFLIEVPNCDRQEFVSISSTQPHTHFFSPNSMEEVIQKSQVDCIIDIRRGTEIPPERSMIIVHNLPQSVTFQTDCIRYYPQTDEINQID